MKVTLITGRTIDQGCSKEQGKLSKEYTNSVSICEMNEEDMRNLRVIDGDSVKVSTEFGSIVVTARTSKRIRSPGMIFVPYSLWVNQVLSSQTDNTGMPVLKGIDASVDPTDETVLSLKEILARTFGEK